ncbi:FAD-dependent oxidoreductase [Filimonas effusa]|uniref:CoA-disulfide reductase n=1 Tax=Filimonas effusa TaxID=2508721 RepID=A0A4Q1D632_9BACT|nr:FAD-dependent oxidoreductase [Filimonas effusa]RXK83107.1 CoA-disulfide reductase [Filimonas effusa]
MKYIIIGAVAGGASTAARLRRISEDAEIIIFERGQYISYANCGLPYYIGDVIKDRNKLFVQTATSFANRFKADIRIRTEVTAIDAEAKTVTAVNLITGEEYTETYDKLVLAPGANPVRPNIPGVDQEGIFTVRSVADTDYIKAYIAKNDIVRAVVIGAGFVGLEMADNLSALGLQVSLVEKTCQVLPAVTDPPLAAIAQQHLREKGVLLHLDTVVTSFRKRDDQFEIKLEDGELLEADIIILAVGAKPDLSLAGKAGLTTGKAGGIRVNEFMQTSNPFIYAVGDAVEFPHPISGQPVVSLLAGPANKQGRICADNMVWDNRYPYRGAINTAIVKLFDLTIGVAGLTSGQLMRSGIKHLVSVTHGNSHAGYYPGAQLLTIQIVFSPEDGQLLGAQVVGADGVDKRLDILATVIKHKGTIYDLMEVEHAYAPPFSSAKDPVNMAGFAAENILKGRARVMQCTEVETLPEDATLIDVRTEAEHQCGTIAGAINIPLDNLRLQLEELPRDKTIYIFCQQGMRGYLAQRILIQNGFRDVINICGGYYLWKAYHDALQLPGEVSHERQMV